MYARVTCNYTIKARYNISLMQVLKQETEPFEMWYHDKVSMEDLGVDTSRLTEVSDNVHFTENNQLQPTIEAIIARSEKLDSFQISQITESMINKVQECIRKFEEKNDEQLLTVTKSKLDKTKECLTKFEANDDLRCQMALKHQERLVKKQEELLIKNLETM